MVRFQISQSKPAYAINRFVFSDAVRRTGRIEITCSEEPIEIYGWVGDTPSKTRKDFRIFGVRNNEDWTDPDKNFHLPYPDYPDGKLGKLLETGKVLFN